MTNEQNKAIVRRFYKAFEEEDQQGLKDVLAPDLVAYNPVAQNLDEHLQGINTWNASFSDNLFEIQEQIAEGDCVVSRVTLHSRLTRAPFQGILPDGRRFDAPAVAIEKIKDGKIVERRIFSESLRMITQDLLDQNQTLARRFIEESGDQDQSAYREMMAPDFIAHLATGPQNRDVFLRHSAVFTAAFSEIQITIHEQAAEEDIVMTRITWRGTHSSEYLSLPPSGKRITITAFLTERIRDGKVVEHWSLFDQMSMMQQLGMIPPP